MKMIRSTNYRTGSWSRSRSGSRSWSESRYLSGSGSWSRWYRSGSVFWSGSGSWSRTRSIR